MIPTIAQICTAIHETLGAPLVVSGELVRSENYNRLSEAINDPRVLQVYPQEILPVSTGSGTAFKTFGADTIVIQESIVIYADYYARQRSHLAEDMGQLVLGIEAMRTILKEQEPCEPFGLENTGSYRWSGARVVFDYAGVLHMGWRWIITLEVF